MGRFDLAGCEELQDLTETRELWNHWWSFRCIPLSYWGQSRPWDSSSVKVKHGAGLHGDQIPVQVLPLLYGFEVTFNLQASLLSLHEGKDYDL